MSWVTAWCVCVRAHCCLMPFARHLRRRSMDELGGFTHPNRDRSYQVWFSRSLSSRSPSIAAMQARNLTASGRAPVSRRAPATVAPRSRVAMGVSASPSKPVWTGARCMGPSAAVLGADGGPRWADGSPKILPRDACMHAQAPLHQPAATPAACRRHTALTPGQLGHQHPMGLLPAQGGASLWRACQPV